MNEKINNPFEVLASQISELRTLLLDIKDGTSKPPPPPPEEDGQRLVTKKQAAKKLNCSTSTIDNYARAGRLTRRYLGRTVRFKLDEVLALAQPINIEKRK